MLRKAKYLLLYLCIFLVVLGVVKDKIFDTPEASFKKVKKVLMGLKKPDEADKFLFTKRKIVYKVYFYSILPIGNMYFISEKEKDECVFSLEVTTAHSWIKRFIEADASVQAYLDKESFLTKRYLEKTKVRDKIKTKEIIFDRKELIAHRNDNKIKIEEGTYDPVGAFIRAITVPYTDQKVYEFKFLSKEEIYILKSSLISKKDGLYELCLEMFREDASSSHGARIYVWVTADEARIPVLFKSWMPAGYGSVVIDSIEMAEGDTVNFSGLQRS